MELTDLPNIGPKLADNLRRGGRHPGAATEAGDPGCVPPHPCPGGPHRLFPPAHRFGRRGGRHSQEGAVPRGEGGAAGLFRQSLIR